MLNKLLFKFVLIFFTFSIVCILSCKSKTNNNNENTGLSPNEGIVTDNDLLVRDKPDTTLGKVKAKLMKDDRVIVLGSTSIPNESFHWYRIKLENGIIGWSYGKYIEMRENTRLKIIDFIYDDEANNQEKLNFFLKEIFPVYLVKLKTERKYEARIKKREIILNKLEELYISGKEKEIIEICQALRFVPIKFFKYWIIGKIFQEAYIHNIYEFQFKNKNQVVKYTGVPNLADQTFFGNYTINENTIKIFYYKKLESNYGNLPIYKNKEVKLLKNEKITEIKIFRIPYDRIPIFLHCNRRNCEDLCNYSEEFPYTSRLFSFVKKIYNLHGSSFGQSFSINKKLLNRDMEKLFKQFFEIVGFEDIIIEDFFIIEKTALQRSKIFKELWMRETE